MGERTYTRRKLIETGAAGAVAGAFAGALPAYAESEEHHGPRFGESHVSLP